MMYIKIESNAETIRKFGIIPAENLASAMDIAGDIGKAYVMPDAYNTFPVISE